MLAESTGKDGKGLIPVDREALGAPEVYGNDRVFAYIRAGERARMRRRTRRWTRWRRPGIRWCGSRCRDIYNLGQELFRWEIATAVAGSMIGINAFNQPDVEASKIATQEADVGIREDRIAAAGDAVLSENGIDLFTDAANAAALASAAGSDKTLVGYLRAHLNRLKAGDYFALLALRRDERGAREDAARNPHAACATGSASRLAWDLVRASCIRPGKLTKAGRTPACSCR